VEVDHDAVMMLTLIVGWLVVSVLFAALWSLVVRRSHELDFGQNEALFDRVEGTDLQRESSPRRTRDGMAEFPG
jgi:hypothetical protein